MADDVTTDPGTNTESRRPSSLAEWLTPSKVVAFAVFAFIPVKLLARRLEDPDLWWHLKTGALIVKNHAIPAVDPFSYTAAGHHWVVQEWGSEVFLYGIYRWFGLYGILFYRALVVLIVYLIVARLLVRRMGSGMGTWALLALTAFAGASNWTERPNLLSFVLFALTLEILDRGGKAMWWFLPITAVWANLHGMVVLGIGLFMLVAIVEWLKVLVDWDGADRARARQIGLIWLLGIVAAFANPYGPGLFVHALRLIRIVSSTISEWASPNFHTVGPSLFLLLLLLTVVGLAFNPKRRDPTDVALALAFTTLGLQAARNLAVASIVLGLVCARYLPGALEVLLPRQKERPEVSQSSSAILGVAGVSTVLVAMVIILAAGFPKSSDPKDIMPKFYPLAAIESLDRTGVRVFVHDSWSGLTIFHDCGPVSDVKLGCPNARVYIDLRWDFYGSKLSDKYSEIHDGLKEWRSDLDEVCTTDVLVPPDAAIAQILTLDDTDWRLVRTDKYSRLFERVHPAPGCST